MDKPKRIIVGYWAPSYLVFAGVVFGASMGRNNVWLGLGGWVWLMFSLFMYQSLFKPELVQKSGDNVKG